MPRKLFSVLLTEGEIGYLHDYVYEQSKNKSLLSRDKKYNSRILQELSSIDLEKEGVMTYENMTREQKNAECYNKVKHKKVKFHVIPEAQAIKDIANYPK